MSTLEENMSHGPVILYGRMLKNVQNLQYNQVGCDCIIRRLDLWREVRPLISTITQEMTLNHLINLPRLPNTLTAFLERGKIPHRRVSYETKPSNEPTHAPQYTDWISEEVNTNRYPGYDTNTFDSKVSVLELWVI